MSVPLEHDYIGLSEASRSSESSNLSAEAEKKNVLNLKATELRLGLPGFGKDSEESETNNGAIKNLMSRAKRGFSDVNVNGSGTWVFSGGSEADLGKSSSVLFSPRSGISAGLENNQTHPSVPLPPPVEDKKKAPVTNENCTSPPAAKAQVVGWPPIRSFRKNTMANNKSGGVAQGNSGSGGCLYVKVSMDGAPYLRKVDLKIYHSYGELSKALEKMFSCFTLGKCTYEGEGVSESKVKDDILHGSDSECVLTYEDKDGDWMLVGDVPWGMFINSCKRLRIMKGSEAIGLEKCK